MAKYSITRQYELERIQENNELVTARDAMRRAGLQVWGYVHIYMMQFDTSDDTTFAREAKVPADPITSPQASESNLYSKAVVFDVGGIQVAGELIWRPYLIVCLEIIS